MIVTAEKISKGSFFKLTLTAFSLGFLLFFLICGIAATFGAETVSWDNQPVKGIKGLLVALMMWPFFSFLMTAFLWCFGVVGLWLYSFYKPLKIEFKGETTTES